MGRLIEGVDPVLSVWTAMFGRQHRGSMVETVVTSGGPRPSAAATAWPSPTAAAGAGAGAAGVGIPSGSNVVLIPQTT